VTSHLGAASAGTVLKAPVAAKASPVTRHAAVLRIHPMTVDLPRVTTSARYQIETFISMGTKIISF
jgi:hypothetical protein